jgi:histidine triad (HIT) family protein
LKNCKVKQYPRGRQEMDCIFCQIIAGKVSSEIVYQDGDIVAFRDINPQAPVHLLIIPRKHIPSLAHLSEADLPLMGQMVNTANQLAKSEGVSERGYRLVVSSGREGAQAIPHLHLHLLGGRQLSDLLG